MFVALSTKAIPEGMKEGVVGEGKWEGVYGVKRVVSGKRWGLVKGDGITRVFNV